MKPSVFRSVSIKTRVTLLTLAVFVAGVWPISFYATWTLRHDMEQLLGEHQFSTVSLMAEEINEELDSRLQSLHRLAIRVAPLFTGSSAVLQASMDRDVRLQNNFSAGVIAIHSDGVAIADVPLATGRVGVNYMDRDYIAAALREGRAGIGRPVAGKRVPGPIVSMAVPVRDHRGKVIGALAGVTDLSKPSFLDKVTRSGYGKAGHYDIVSRRHRLIVTSSDKSRLMEAQPARGINPAVDSAIDGDVASVVYVNPRGVEVLGSAKGVPVADWYVGATVPTAEAFAPIRAMERRMLFGTGALTLLACSLIWWLTRRMLTRQFMPMIAAAGALDALSKAPQPLRPLPGTRDDEIGALISGFNHLLASLGQRERALVESRALMESLLQTIPFPIDIVDPQGQVLFMSERMARAVGRPGEGQRCWELYRDDRSQCTACPLRGPIERGKTYAVESAGVFGGRIFEIQHTGMTYQGREAIMEVFVDITEHKEAEADVIRRNHSLKELYARLQTVREEERYRLARELHDDLGQRVTALRMDLDWIDYRLQTAAPSVTGKMAGVSAQIDELADSIRRLTEDMRPGLLNTLGLVAAVKEYVERFAARTGIRCELAAGNDLVDVGDQAGIGIYRIVQEALNNVLKHAAASRVSVTLRRAGNAIALTIADDGVGLPETADTSRQGFGVLGMRERVATLNGEMTLTSQAGRGVRIEVVVPM